MNDNQIVTSETCEGVTVLSFSVKGTNITEAIMFSVSSAFQAAANADPPKVIVDLTDVAFFSSSFIEVMFRLWNRLKKDERGGFALVGLNEYCREILDITNLTSVWSIYDTREEAVAALLAA